MRHYRTLPYYGGKNKRGSNKVGPKIARILPRNGAYIEPYAGMLGVLLQREPVKMEIVNDLNSDLINWWRCIRDKPDEFQHRVEYTPSSREELSDAYDYLVGNTFCSSFEEADIQRGVAYNTLIANSINHGYSKSWAIKFDPKSNRITIPDVKNLSHRLRHVQIENRNAEDVLERTAEIEDITVYCDPPYSTANTSPYAHEVIDSNRVKELLLLQKGDCAISGYNDEWDGLGWNRIEFPTITHGIGKDAGITQQRTEVLWTNFSRSEKSIFGDIDGY